MINKILRISLICALLFIQSLSLAFSETTDEKMDNLCKENNSVACFKLGQKALSLDKDNKKAIAYFKKSCDLDHMTACNFGGALIQNSGKQYSPQWKEASKMFEKACNAGEDSACFNQGALKYKEGRASKAKKYFQKACDMGNPVGCDNVKWLNK